MTTNTLDVEKIGETFDFKFNTKLMEYRIEPNWNERTNAEFDSKDNLNIQSKVGPHYFKFRIPKEELEKIDIDFVSLSAERAASKIRDAFYPSIYEENWAIKFEDYLDNYKNLPKFNPKEQILEDN